MTEVFCSTPRKRPFDVRIWQGKIGSASVNIGSASNYVTSNVRFSNVGAAVAGAAAPERIRDLVTFRLPIETRIQPISQRGGHGDLGSQSLCIYVAPTSLCAKVPIFNSWKMGRRVT